MVLLTFHLRHSFINCCQLRLLSFPLFGLLLPLFRVFLIGSRITNPLLVWLLVQHLNDLSSAILQCLLSLSWCRGVGGCFLTVLRLGNSIDENGSICGVLLFNRLSRLFFLPQAAPKCTFRLCLRLLALWLLL